MMRGVLKAAAVVLNLFALDAAAKQMAVGRLQGRPSLPVVDGFFNLAYVENRGCAWGMLQGHVWPLAAFAIVALAFAVWKRRELFAAADPSPVRRGWGAAAERLLYAGVAGNLFDRLVRGCVIDFFDFHWGERYHFPCFNFADVYITCAAAILLALSCSEKRGAGR